MYNNEAYRNRTRGYCDRRKWIHYFSNLGQEELTNLQSLENLEEVDLYRIFKATQGIKLKEYKNYIINAKQVKQFKLNKISFRTD